MGMLPVYLECGDSLTHSLPSSCLLHWSASLDPITRTKEKAAHLVQQHRPVDRPPVSNVTLHAEMMRKTDKARFSTEKKKKKRHAEAVLLIPQLKLSFIKRNKKVTEWLSLGLLGRLLQTWLRFTGMISRVQTGNGELTLIRSLLNTCTEVTLLQIARRESCFRWLGLGLCRNVSLYNESTNLRVSLTVIWISEHCRTWLGNFILHINKA